MNDKCGENNKVEFGREELVQHYRNTTLHGFFVDLVPLSEKYAKEIVDLRNTERALHNLSQQYKLTEEKQIAWTKEYFIRNNDLYWCILDKKGDFLGTYRAYNMDFEKNTAEVGSTVMLESRAKERPYFLEATLIVHDFLFCTMGITAVVAHIRKDNVKVRSFDAHIGAIERGETLIYGTQYIETYISKDMFSRDKLKKILDHWIFRENKRDINNKNKQYLKN